MALADVPAELILRMLHLQAKAGFAADCQIFPSGDACTPFPLEAGEAVYGVFKKHHHFSNQAVISNQRSGRQRINWSQIRSSSVISRGYKDVLSISGIDGAVIEIDLSHPTGQRPAMRIDQLVTAMAKRWSNEAVSGLPLVDIDAFFDAAESDEDFAVNLFPEKPSLSEFRAAFERLASRPDVDDVKIVLCDPEDESSVYAEAIAIASSASPETFLNLIKGVPQHGPLPADENIRRKMKLRHDAPVWVVAWG